MDGSVWSASQRELSSCDAASGATGDANEVHEQLAEQLKELSELYVC